MGILEFFGEFWILGWFDSLSSDEGVPGREPSDSVSDLFDWLSVSLISLIAPWRTWTCAGLVLLRQSPRLLLLSRALSGLGRFKWMSCWFPLGLISSWPASGDLGDGYTCLFVLHVVEDRETGKSDIPVHAWCSCTLLRIDLRNVICQFLLSCVWSRANWGWWVGQLGKRFHYFVCGAVWVMLHRYWTWWCVHWWSRFLVAWRGVSWLIRLRSPLRLRWWVFAFQLLLGEWYVRCR